MRDLVILFIHLIATFARHLGPGGMRSVVAESVLVKQQLLILNRSRQRSPNLRASDRLVAGLCTLKTRLIRLIRQASERHASDRILSVEIRLKTLSREEFWYSFGTLQRSGSAK